MKQKKVLHVLKSHVYSGAENMVCQIINMFKEEFTMYYASPRGSIQQILQKKSIRFIPLKRFTPIQIQRIVSMEEIDIIHTHDPAASVLVSVLNLKKRIIAHVHGNHDNMKKLTLKSLLFLLASKRFYTIIWVSESSLKEYYFYEYVKNKSIVLMNVINAEEIKKKAKNSLEEKYDCIFLGRLSPEKDPFRAIDIIRSVVDEIPDYKVVFVGDGPLYDECIRYVGKSNLENNIIFKGFQRNPIPYLANSKVLLMSSRYEGTPMSALEAMCLGKPIVSTPTDGLLKLITLGETGFYSNENKEISDFLVQLKLDDDRYEFMVQQSKKKFNEVNNIDKYKEKVMELYE